MLYYVVANPESAIVEAEGPCEAKEKMFHHLSACYGYGEFNILNVVDVSDRDDLIYDIEAGNITVL